MMLRVGGKHFIPPHNKYAPLRTNSFSPKTSYPSQTFQSFTPAFNSSTQITQNFNFSQQKRNFDVHPFFQNAFRNIKKSIYHRVHNLFLPGHEKVKTSVYHVFNPWLYFDFKREQKERWSKFKRKLHKNLSTNHFIFYKFIRHYLTKRQLRLKRPKKKRRQKIFTTRSPERVQELLPNRKRVLFDPLRRHAEYDDSLYHIKNLTHKYYKQNNDFDILGDEKLRKTIAAYQKQPVNPRLVRGLFNLNKKSKTTALIEGYKTFKILRTSKPAARFKRSFPVIVSAWRALKQQFSRLKVTKRGWVSYLQLQNPHFHPTAVKAIGHKSKRALIMFLDKGDIEPLFRIYYAMEEDPEELMEEMLSDQEETIFGSAASNPLVMYGGFRRQQTIRTTNVKYKGHRYFEEEDVIVFHCKFRRIYTSLKRKYRIRKMRVFFTVIYDPDERRYFLRSFRFSYRRRRKSLG